MTDPKHKTLQLLFPITIVDREVSEVTITRPKVKDLKAMDAALDGIKDKLDQGIVMAATLTGLPPEVIEELDAEDFTKLSEEVASFFPQAKAHGTGAPSLPKPPTG
ncbi:MAG: phage tail assembly protein [Pelagibaca sp.]